MTVSIDNGIYILKTKDNQHRVIHTQAIENIYWSYIDECYKDKPVSTRIVEYFGDARYTYNQDIARDIAFGIARKNETEFGIREIIVNKTWNQIMNEAKQIGLLELEVLRSKEVFM
jgi:hypothetical protein